MRKLGVAWFSFVVLLVVLLAVGAIALFVGVDPGTGMQTSPWREVAAVVPWWVFFLSICGALVYGISRKMPRRRLIQGVAVVGGLGLLAMGWVWWWNNPTPRARKVAVWAMQVGATVTVDKWKSGSQALKEIREGKMPVSPGLDEEQILKEGLWSEQGRAESPEDLPKGRIRVWSIDLEGTRVTDADLGHLQELTFLYRLILRGTRVTDAGLAHLRRLPVTHLDLSQTHITDAGLVYLMGPIHLDLSQTQITDAGLAHIRELDHLMSLDLSGTRVTDAGLSHLKSLTYLHSVDLSGTRVTDAGVRELKRALPGVEIGTVSPVTLPR